LESEVDSSEALKVLRIDVTVSFEIGGAWRLSHAQPNL